MLNEVWAGRERSLRLGDNQTGEDLAPLLIIKSHRPRVLNSGHVLESIINPNRRDIEASGDDHIVCAPHDFQASTRVNHSGISADEPACAEFVVEGSVLG